jgi:hypothetical protein
MPPPLHLSDEEMDLLLALAAPIDHQQRAPFLAAVAAELEANGQAGAVGIGSVHRVARTVQRRFFDPPQLPNASKVARLVQYVGSVFARVGRARRPAEPPRAWADLPGA